MINDTKIQYLLVGNKIYKVNNINFLHLYIEAIQTDLSVNDVPEEELWNISELSEFRIRLINPQGDTGIIIDFEEWKKKHDS